MGFFKNKDVEDTYMEAELHEEVDFAEDQEHSVQPQVVDEEERRAARRKRRVRNEILVYMSS